MFLCYPDWIKKVFEIRNWFESARKYFVIGQKSVLKNDGLFVFLLFPRCAFPPLRENIFAGTEAAASVQNYKFPLTFLIFHVFPPPKITCTTFLSKTCFSHFLKLFSNFKKCKQHVSNFYKNTQFPLVLLLAWSKSHWPARVYFKLVIKRAAKMKPISNTTNSNFQMVNIKPWENNNIFHSLKINLCKRHYLLPSVNLNCKMKF